MDYRYKQLQQDEDEVLDNENVQTNLEAEQRIERDMARSKQDKEERGTIVRELEKADLSNSLFKNRFKNMRKCHDMGT